MKRLASLIVAIAIALASFDVAAAPPPPLAESLRGDARVLYDAARELFRSGDYASAYAKFQRALEISKDPRLYWNLAACERKSKHNANVLRLIKSYLDEGQSLLTEADRAEASRAAAAVRAFVAAATITSQPADGVDVFVDDVRVATTPVREPIWVDMGPHRVRFAKDGYRSVERNEEIPAGGELSWSITLEKNEASAVKPPPPPTPHRDPPPQIRTRSLVGPALLGGAGIAAAAVGTILVVTTSSRFGELEASCGTACAPSEWEGERTKQIAGDVLIGVGAAALVGAVIWWIATPYHTEAAPDARVPGRFVF